MKIDIIEHEPPYRVGVIIGSLSRESINRRLANALTHLAPEGFEFFEISYATCRSTTVTTMPTIPRSRWISRTPSRARTRCCSSRPSTTARCRDR